jgi:hypothetical protein
MKKAIELYPDSFQYSFDSTGDYQPIINSFGDILVQVDDDNYQGDSLILLEKDGKYGLLQFGWGSCSGCDALQSCESHEDVDELIESLHNRIVWHDNIKDMIKVIRTRDWDGCFMDKDLVREFQSKFEKYLEITHPEIVN